jgi:hypothetical protein
MGKITNVQGSCPSVTFQLQGYTVQTSSATAISRGPCKDLTNGSDVTVHGELQTGNVVKATRIEFNR